MCDLQCTERNHSAAMQTKALNRSSQLGNLLSTWSWSQLAGGGMYTAWDRHYRIGASRFGRDASLFSNHHPCMNSNIDLGTHQSHSNLLNSGWQSTRWQPTSSQEPEMLISKLHLVGLPWNRRQTRSMGGGDPIPRRSSISIPSQLWCTSRPWFIHFLYLHAVQHLVHAIQLQRDILVKQYLNYMPIPDLSGKRVDPEYVAKMREWGTFSAKKSARSIVWFTSVE